MMTRNIGTFEKNGLAIVEIVFSLLEKENEGDFFRDFWPYRDHTDKRLLVYSFICSRVSPQARRSEWIMPVKRADSTSPAYSRVSLLPFTLSILFYVHVCCACSLIEGTRATKKRFREGKSKNARKLRTFSSFFPIISYFFISFSFKHVKEWMMYSVNEWR